MIPCLAAIALTIATASNPEPDQPYDLQIVLRVVPHRLLTPTFRAQLTTEIRDSMQAALGTMAQVEVIDAVAKPAAWQPLDSLPHHPELATAKRHFVQIEFADGQYVVTARQHDGATGQASPRIRTGRTSDRAFVARLVVRFLGLDFGPVGAVIGKDGDRVRLQLQGGAIAGNDLARWIKPGAVFALCRIEGEPPRGKAIPATYLRALGEPAGGICECQLVSRYLNPLGDWPQAPYHAIRLGTTAAPIHLRLVDANGLPQSNLLVLASPAGFRSNDPITDQGTTRDGWFNASKPYDGLAFIRVMTGDRQIPIPIAVIDEEPVICEVAVAANSEARQQYDLDVRNARQRLQDILRRLSEQNRQFDALLRDSRNKDALERAQAGLEVLDSELRVLSTEVMRLRREASKQNLPPNPLLDQCELFLKDIRARRDSLSQFETNLKRAADSENSPENQAKREHLLALIQRADTLREEADFDGVIRTYEQILQEFGNRPDIQKRLDDLKAAWKIKSEEHQRARDYAYNVWAKITTFEEIKERLPKAREMFEVCRSVGDKLTALKFSLVASNAADIIVRTVENLEQSQAESDKVNLKDARRISQELQAFLSDLSKFIRSDEKK